MTFRVEEKILVNIKDMLKVKNFLRNNKAKTLYPKRQINSLYFDNVTSQMFVDSEEGCVPRKKIRIRHYGKKNEILKLETKISSVEGKFKTTKKIDKNFYNTIKKKGFFDLQYGWCKPVIWTQYERKYFAFDDFRITLDEKIKYFNVNNGLIANDKYLIFEIKTPIKTDINKLIQTFPFSRTRFSKYANGVNLLNS
tara:strand:- start:801 stop:1388 length:588 start_codon:yes stop_codon:yes gene_type:complete